MQGLFLQTLRWYILVAFVIAGIGALHIADKTETIKPVLPGVLCLGAAFVLATLWKDIRQKILFFTVAIVAAPAYAATFSTDLIYLATGRLIDLNYFVAWAGLTFIIGFPAMMYVFRKYGD